MHYVILKQGYEGIEKVMGLFDEKTAIDRMTLWRKTPDDEWTETEQYCINTIDENGVKCVCGKLGFGLKKMWLN